jgi:6-phosphogluconate dehydrogenase
MTSDPHFGLTGLATMGANLARNVAHHDIPVAVHNRTTHRMETFIEEHGSEGPLTGHGSVEDWVGSLARPRVLMSMVQAGDATDAVIEEIGTPCCTYVGPDGAGHYVKMVHNGIEYADMQLIAESYDLLRHGAGLEVPEIAQRFERWNESELESFLIEIAARVLAKTDETTGQPLVDVILDAAGQKGTGRWTAQDALELGVPLTGITEAVFARSLSALKQERAAAADRLAGPSSKDGTDARLADDLEHALYASKIVSYAQGFAQMTAASQTEGWNLDLGSMATIWRGGCIIRARFLDRIREAYDAEPGLANLMLGDFFATALAEAQDPWRRVVARAAELGIPTPAFSSSLAYYDGYRRARGPASLIQGLRDLFGAHTYQRIDRDGTFHIQWSGDERETKA